MELEGSLSSTILDLDQAGNKHHHNFPQYETAMDHDVGGSSSAIPSAQQPNEDDDMLEGDNKDSKNEGSARKRRAEIWQDAEMDALVRAFREVHMKLTSAAGTGKKVKQVFKSAGDKWQEVRTLLLAAGVDRSPKEIERKWSNLSTAFKQIADWNTKKGGRPSYWDLDESLKKEKTKAKELPATFRVQLFDAMAEFMGDRQGSRSRSPAQSQQQPSQPGGVVAMSPSPPVQQLQLVPVPGLPRPPPAAPGPCSLRVPKTDTVKNDPFLIDACFSTGVMEVPLPVEKLAIHVLDAANQ